MFSLVQDGIYICIYICARKSPYAVLCPQFSSVQDGIYICARKKTHMRLYVSIVQFSSRWYLYTLGKAYIRSTQSLRSSPDVTFGTVPNVHLTDDGSSSSFPGRSPGASSFHASLLQLIDGVLSLVLCPQVVSQAPQHFRSSETQATYQGCFSRQSIDSVIFLHSCSSLQAKTRQEKQKFFF